MRVVNSPRLWDNHVQKRQSHLPLNIFVAAVLLGLTIAGIIIGIGLRQSSVKIAAVSKPVYKSVLAGAPQTMPPSKQLLPEQNDLGDLLMHKLATPLPPPAADCAASPCIALTFDDGPNPASTGIILDALQKEDVKATFFVVGNRVAPNAMLIQRMHEQGEEIGNHSWAHPDFTRLNAAQIAQQIDLTQAAVVAAGATAPTIFRTPYGSLNSYVRQQVHLPIVLWSVDPKDWKETDSNRIVQIVESQAKPGAIILMHDKLATAAAVSKIVQDLKVKYRLVTASQLLNIAPSTQGVFFGR